MMDAGEFKPSFFYKYLHQNQASDLDSQIRSAAMSQLQRDIIRGLTDGMSMKNMAKFREYVDKNCFASNFSIDKLR